MNEKDQSSSNSQRRQDVEEYQDKLEIGKEVVPEYIGQPSQAVHRQYDHHEDLPELLPHRLSCKHHHQIEVVLAPEHAEKESHPSHPNILTQHDQQKSRQKNQQIYYDQCFSAHLVAQYRDEEDTDNYSAIGQGQD